MEDFELQGEDFWHGIKQMEILLTSVDNGGIRQDWMFDCLDRRNLMSLFNLALNDCVCGNLGKRGGLDVGIYSIREAPSDVYEGEEE